MDIKKLWEKTVDLAARNPIPTGIVGGALFGITTGPIGFAVGLAVSLGISYAGNTAVRRGYATPAKYFLKSIGAGVATYGAIVLTSVFGPNLLSKDQTSAQPTNNNHIVSSSTASMLSSSMPAKGALSVAFDKEKDTFVVSTPANKAVATPSLQA